MPWKWCTKSWPILVHPGGAQPPQDTRAALDERCDPDARRIHPHVIELFAQDVHLEETVVGGQELLQCALGAALVVPAMQEQPLPPASGRAHESADPEKPCRRTSSRALAACGKTRNLSKTTAAKGSTSKLQAPSGRVNEWPRTRLTR
jgi:hypothetical protein